MHCLVAAVNYVYQQGVDPSLTADDPSIDYVSLSKRSPCLSLSDCERAPSADEYSTRPRLRSFSFHLTFTGFFPPDSSAGVRLHAAC